MCAPTCNYTHFVENLKCIFAGTPIAVKVKYENDAVVNKTPVLLSTNVKYFEGESLDERICKVYLDKI